MLTLANLATSTPGVLLTILQFLVVLTIVVFVHEFGHFIVARWCGVTVKTFSIGFGREIFGFTDRKGTRWRFAWIPLGGYVKFVDDENAASQPSPDALERMTPAERTGAFQNKPLWQRAAVVAAGPASKFPIGCNGLRRRQCDLRRAHHHPHRGAVKEDMPAAAAGIKPGDVITSIDGWTVEGLRGHPAHRRHQRRASLALQHRSRRREAVGRGDARGARAARHLRRHVPPRPDRHHAVHRGRLPGGQIRRSYRGAYGSACAKPTPTSPTPCRASADIVTQRQAADQMGGPILMAQVTAKVAEGGIEPMLRWIAFISANIGFLNLLPIPVLDGGHLVYYAIEGVLRRPMSRRMQEIGFQIGVALVLMLMVYVNLNDLLRVWRGWTGAG